MILNRLPSLKIIKIGAFIVWFLSIVLFVGLSIYVNHNYKSGIYPNEISTLYLIFILVGIVSFLVMIFSTIAQLLLSRKGNFLSNKIKKIFPTNSNVNLMLLVFIVLIFGTLYLGYKVEVLSKKNSLIVLSPTSTPIATQTPESIETPIQNNKVVQNGQSILCTIHANCGGGTRSLTKQTCEASTCCQIGDKWTLYLSKDDCKKDQDSYAKTKNINTNNTYVNNNNYTTCTVYYPLLKYSQTYTYVTSEQCSLWQSQANSYTTTTSLPTNPPQPTTDPNYQNLLNQHTEACNQASAEWRTQKEQFYANEYNNFTSSSQAMMELERRRQIYQQELYDAGCTNTISL